MGVYEDVAGVAELGGGEEGVCEGGFEDASEGEVFGGEGMDFGARVADAGLQVED